MSPLRTGSDLYRLRSSQVVTQDPQPESAEYRQPTGPFNESVLDDDDCPLAILMDHPPMRGQSRDPAQERLVASHRPVIGQPNHPHVRGQSWLTSTTRPRGVSQI